MARNRSPSANAATNPTTGTRRNIGVADGPTPGTTREAEVVESISVEVPVTGIPPAAGFATATEDVVKLQPGGSVRLFGETEHARLTVPLNPVPATIEIIELPVCPGAAIVTGEAPATEKSPLPAVMLIVTGEDFADAR